MELEGNLGSVGFVWEWGMLLSPPASASTGGQREQLLSGDSDTELGGKLSCPLGGVTPTVGCCCLHGSELQFHAFKMACNSTTSCPGRK